MPCFAATCRLLFVLLAILPVANVLAQTSASPEPERMMLRDPVQLTFGDRFVKAGESYYSPDGSKIIFQAVEQRQDEAPDDFSPL